MDFLIYVLAAYRITRLLVYDDIFYFVREWAGVYDIEKDSPLKRVLLCPFCFSVWVSLLVWAFTLYNESMALTCFYPFAIAGGVALIYEVLNDAD